MTASAPSSMTSLAEPIPAAPPAAFSFATAAKSIVSGSPMRKKAALPNRGSTSESRFSPVDVTAIFIIRLSCFKDGGQSLIAFSFELLDALVDLAKFILEILRLLFKVAKFLLGRHCRGKRSGRRRGIIGGTAPGRITGPGPAGEARPIVPVSPAPTTAPAPAPA